MKPAIKVMILITVIFMTLFIEILLENTSVSNAQTSNPPTTVSVTPGIDPTITSLQNTVATQEIEIQSLKRDFDYEVREFKWWFLVAGVVAAITGFSGYQAYRGIPKQIRQKVRILTNKYFYQLDVTNLETIK